MKRYCITDDLNVVARAATQGAHLIQIRAKELPTRDLITLVKGAVLLAGAKVLVNGRIDVALAYGAGGVHLPSHSIAPNRIRKIAPPRFLIGVSCHTVDELKRAEAEGADFAVYGPMFATGDKRPIGFNALRQATSAVRLPIYALGGINESNVSQCLEAGAAGVAGISLFRPSPATSP